MTPEQAEALRDAINHCRHTSRKMMLEEGTAATAAMDADDAAIDEVNRLITELTQ